MPKQGEEYERFVQDVYKVLNANDGLNDSMCIGSFHMGL